MAAQQLPEWYTCGYSVSKREDMRNLKELPCQHVFCLSRIQGHYSKHKSVTCPIKTCGEVCDSLEFEGLPKVSIAAGDSNTLFCTARECQGQIAVSYCVTCKDKFCSHHQQAHKTLHSDSHKVVEIDVYKRSPASYDKPTCEHHQEVLVRACKKCDKLICFECEIDGYDCTDQERHDFKSLTSLKEEVNTYFSSQLKVIAEKITNVCTLDKKVWNDLDNQEEKCSDVIREIEKARDEMIQKVRNESQELITRVTNLKENVTNQVEEFFNKLMLKKDELEKTQAEVHRLLIDGHVTEKIREKKRIAEEMGKHDAEELGDCNLTGLPTLIETGQNTSRLLNVSLVTVPSSLTFISEHETDGWCLAAHHRQDGDMLIGTSNGIQLLNRDGNELSEYSTSEEVVTGVIETPQNVFTLHGESHISKVEMYLAGDITKRQQLFQFDRTALGAAVMAVSDRYVVVSHPDTKQLIIYDFITKQTETIHPDVYPFGLHFLPDGHLLGVGGDKLMKYKVEKRKLNTVWTCYGVTDGYSVCTDSDSLIYVSGMSLKLLYIISPSGVILKTLTHDKLPSNFFGVPSIRDGILAVPGWDEKKVCLFKIETEIMSQANVKLDC